MKKLIIFFLTLSSIGCVAQLKPVEIPRLSYPVNDDILQRKAGQWVPRTLAQLAADLNFTLDVSAVSYADTATLFTAYRAALNLRLRWSDSTNLLADYRTALLARIKYSDTSTILSTYRTAINARVLWSDTATLFSDYRTAINLRATKTYTDAADALQIKYTDSASMLSTYRTALLARVKYTDSTSILSTYQTALNNRYTISAADALLATKQATLVSGTNIKTINGFSILGAGDLVIAGGGSAVWGGISGTLADQTDLINALNAKANAALTLTIGSTTSDLSANRTFLANVDNTSDATKNSATATLTNKTLTSPVINTPTGINKGDVGLGSADNTSDVNKPVSNATKDSLNTRQYIDSALTQISAVPSVHNNMLIYDTTASVGFVGKTIAQLKTIWALDQVGNYSPAALFALTKTLTNTTINFAGGNGNVVSNIPALSMAPGDTVQLDLRPPIIRYFQMLGGRQKVESLLTTYFGTTNGTSGTGVTMTSGRLLFIPAEIYEDMTVTGVGFEPVGASVASYTGNNENKVGLYQISGTNMVRVAQSTDSANMWKGAVDVYFERNFSAPYAATKGTYYVALLWSASATTLGPAILSNSGNARNQASLGFGTDKYVGYMATGQTTMGSTYALSALTSQTERRWVTLY